MRLFLVFMVLVISGCDTNLNIGTRSGSMIKSPDGVDPVTDAGPKSVELKIESASFQLQDDLAEIAWTGDVTKEVVVTVAAKSDCSDEVTSVTSIEKISHVSMANVPEGTYYVCLVAEVDGKKMSAVNSGLVLIIITRSSTPPVFSSLNRANDALDGYINQAESSSLQALFTLVGSDFVKAEYSQPQPITVSCNDSLSYPHAAMPSPADVTSDGEWAFCVRLTNNVGVRTYGKSQSFERDTFAPTVNVGADLLRNTAFTTSATTSGGTSYAWSKQPGPGSIAFGSPSADNTTVTVGADGTYTIRLTVSDAAGNVSFDEFDLVWDTTPPVVNVGADEEHQSIFTKTASVTGATSYAWSVVSGTSSNIVFGSPNAASTSINATQLGTYTVRLTATDAVGNSASDDFVLTWGKGEHLIYPRSPNPSLQVCAKHLSYLDSIPICRFTYL